MNVNYIFNSDRKKVNYLIAYNYLKANFVMLDLLNYF
jgi:hypothetical protein